MTQLPKIPNSEITPEPAFMSRRLLMKAGLVVGTTLATGAVYRALNGSGRRAITTPELADVTTSTAPSAAGFVATDAKSTFDDITHYNNFYEFSTDKEAVADAAAKFVTTGWTVAVDGLVSKPQTFDMDGLRNIAPLEERVYRMRCVEGWSMVIPWDGYSLSQLLRRVEPLSKAKYVAFKTLQDPQRMPGQKDRVLPWPYVEGLRMDEAMHPLTLLASGIYGRGLPAQNGAPIRLVTPWKYGFKGIKSIIKISLVEEMPPTTWNMANPDEYGFYANVNPAVDHPRWSQATERRVGELNRRPTLPFNGYAEQVAGLYTKMDLRKYF